MGNAMSADSNSKWQDKIAKIEKIDKIDPSNKLDITPEIAQAEPIESSKFHQELARVDPVADRGHPKIDLEGIDTPNTSSDPKLSPITEINNSESRVERLKSATVGQVAKQAEELKTAVQQPLINLEQLQSSQGKLKLTPAQETALQDRLIHIDSSLRTSLAKAGVEVKAADIQPIGQKPLVKFLNYLTSADHQLTTLIDQLNGVAGGDKKLSPEKLIALQIKLGFVQNELEFFTNVLNKAMESTKTIMNVQV
jgi:hypothetical protein